jgi:hypothetical protein
MFVQYHIGLITSKTMEVVNVDWDRSFFIKHGQHMNRKGRELMVTNTVTDIKNILQVNRKTPISMKWKDDQNKDNQISEEGENEVRGETVSNEIHDVNVSLRTNTG